MCRSPPCAIGGGLGIVRSAGLIALGGVGVENQHPGLRPRQLPAQGPGEQQAQALMQDFFRNLRIELKTRPKWKKPLRE